MTILPTIKTPADLKRLPIDRLPELAAEMRRAAEQVVARLSEQRIPVRPTSTATFNADHAYGSADDAIAYVERLRDAGADEIMCLVQMGTVPQEACMETLRQWGEKVIPHFRATEHAGERAPERAGDAG